MRLPGYRNGAIPLFLFVAHACTSQVPEDEALRSAAGSGRAQIGYFGALCDGKTDDLGAIQKTLDAAHSSPTVKTVYLPSGTRFNRAALHYYDDVVIWDDSNPTYPSLVIGGGDAEFRIEYPDKPAAATNAPYLVLINRRKVGDRTTGIVSRWGDDGSPRNTWQLAFGRDERTQGWIPDFLLMSWGSAGQVCRQTTGVDGGFIFNPDSVRFDPTREAGNGHQFVFNNRKEAEEMEPMGVVLRSRTRGAVNLDFQAGGVSAQNRFSRAFGEACLSLWGGNESKKQLMKWDDSGLVTMEGDLVVNGKIINNSSPEANISKTVFSSREERSTHRDVDTDLLGAVVLSRKDLASEPTYSVRASGHLSAPCHSILKVTLTLGSRCLLQSRPFRIGRALEGDYFDIDSVFSIRSGSIQGAMVGAGRLEIVSAGGISAIALTPVKSSPVAEGSVEAGSDQLLRLRLDVQPPEQVAARSGREAPRIWKGDTKNAMRLLAPSAGATTVIARVEKLP